ncbi:septum site-determining protein MinC [Peptostreptococcus canis]|uniref:Septum formation inhibitor MinC C-terminal domain-containing protein n=1 Tax=Peptostreptococcus canis TaxID=1159213 RepID=A0ABR6TKY8_9FIRM|nr:septum site-determining protein MinC [Peptostreptococcus canis]MBC2576081.1 hypothetical protein [Peptostreptococcus canis]MBP1997793.1 septum formation inhibitor MinC [Peptostreptococcus canis]
MIKTKIEEIEFKGTGKGLVLYINKEISIESIFDLISSKVLSSPGFFIGGILTEIVSDYISPYQKNLIVEYLSDNYNMKFIGVDEFHFNELMKQKEYRGATALFKAVRTLYVMDISEGEEINYNGSVIIMTTLPANSIVKVSCDIIVLGSTEKESALIAGGNITVTGELRGLAYAGAYGNDSACIIARRINSPRIAIFDCESEYVVSQRNTTMNNPEIAYIDEHKHIVISQKKEVLFRYSPESIKDTSYGAFDLSEQGVMMEKNESVSDYYYDRIEKDDDDEYYDDYDVGDFSEGCYDENYHNKIGDAIEEKIGKYDSDKINIKNMKDSKLVNKLKDLFLEDVDNVEDEENRL